ncbi:MAG: DUF4097 family beta strand repeat-containing protein [Acidimicrobiales bacterium]
MSEDVTRDRLVLRATTSSARLRVVAEDRADVLVDGRPQIPESSTVTVQARSGSLEVRVPVGTELVLGTISGRVEVGGSIGPAKVATESGRVAIDRAERIDVRTQSGRVDIENSVGHCRVQSTSGRVSVGGAHGLDVHTESGRISVDDVQGPVHLRTTSGRVSVGLSGSSEVDAEAMSGRIDITVARGLGTTLTVEGAPRRVEADVEPGDDCLIRARAVSGRIRVRQR